jgi:hypothetical protein
MRDSLTLSSTLNWFKFWWEFSLARGDWLSCNSCSRLTGAWELRKLWCKLSLLNSHATLVLVWPGHESWENSHANSRFSTLMQLLFSFDRGMRVEKTLMQTLASQLSCNSCSRLTVAWEMRKQTLASQLSSDRSFIVKSVVQYVFVRPAVRN